MLAPIYGAVVKLLNRLTQALADRVDATISSRAPASTALSTATWTGTRATAIDNLDAAVNTLAAAADYTSGRAANLDYLDVSVAATTRIKSIQRGTISITGTNLTATATITSVTTGKTRLRILGVTNHHAGSSMCAGITLALTNATTITATRQYSVSCTQGVGWELTEFY